MKHATWWAIGAWALGLGLLAWALQRVEVADIWAALRQLRFSEALVLIGVNGGILVLFGLRWWLILSAFGFPVPIKDVVRYRVASFGVSYFTPGPHFGGEPLQVYMLHREHDVPLDVATASVGLDKLFELMANFTFLTSGMLVILGAGLAGESNRLAWMGGGVLLAMPALYFIVLMVGGKPISGTVRGLMARGPAWARKAARFVTDAETQMSDFSRAQPRAMSWAFLMSGVVWAAMIAEFMLLLGFLDIRVNFEGVVVVMTAARLALLTPLPGALGALETSQALAFGALGFDPAGGWGVSLIIRGRDVAVGLTGLAIGTGFRPARRPPT